MDLNRLTEQSQAALGSAQELAVRRNHQGVDSIHLLAALLEDKDGLVVSCFANAMPQVSGPGMEA
jgi:ATP-dependent Clp protease ATP-binding subunit ClpB